MGNDDILWFSGSSQVMIMFFKKQWGPPFFIMIDDFKCKSWLNICSVRVSNELGRGNSRAAKFSIVVTVITSFTIGFFLFLFFLFYRERLAYIFTTNKQVSVAIGDLSPLLAISILLNSVQPVLSGISIYFSSK